MTHASASRANANGARFSPSVVPAQTPVEAQLDEWIAPPQCDELGQLRAGQILEWMDVVGSLAAVRHARRPVVTASVDGVELAEPILVGERVTMTAQVAHTSARSMGVAVTMTHGMPGTPHRHTLHGWMTFVAVGEQGASAPIAPVLTDSAAARTRFREGELRREFRRKLLDGTLSSETAALPQDSEERRLFVREFLKHLPRLRAPWDLDPAPRARGDSYVHTIEMVRADSLNAHGTLYGGVAMRWLENNAQLSARAHLGGAAVRCTGLHGLTFVRPAERDVFVHLRAMVVHADESQLTVLVTVESEKPTAGELSETLRAFLTYAPHDARAKVPPVVCDSDEERALLKEVELRLSLRRSLLRERES